MIVIGWQSRFTGGVLSEIWSIDNAFLLDALEYLTTAPHVDSMARGAYIFPNSYKYNMPEAKKIVEFIVLSKTKENRTNIS